MTWTIYLSGEVHTAWREELKEQAATRGLPVRFTSAVTDHPASDAAARVRASGMAVAAEAMRFAL